MAIPAHQILAVPLTLREMFFGVSGKGFENKVLLFESCDAISKRSILGFKRSMISSRHLSAPVGVSSSACAAFDYEVDVSKADPYTLPETPWADRFGEGDTSHPLAAATVVSHWLSLHAPPTFR
ncbi:MAG: hypothetical protein F4022_04665 [Gemmatimonadetes bacterium]|nr:hypothetical protein [Gemmatimonadota bacterium]